ncbi:putative vacuolar membrane transporter for cationic amino acids [Kickxella alabastrina]|uniref:Vacuolar membrane transporter for cationic amino acids n=1 Tax=Kickxella alabastrina TaxID=61397 RepID=A0ACC1IJW0_9FUNG|nr:putative vacuolar membrane transporter for cationic amino acids [Kickxella alabastrina]
MIDPSIFISSFFGYTSILCWVVVLFPQIHLNYKRKSCDGISLTFYLMWSLGDLLNLVGAVMENLIITAVLLPLYYILTDGIIIWQFYSYRSNHPRPDSELDSEADEESWLILHPSPNQSNCDNNEHAIFSTICCPHSALIGAGLLLAGGFALYYCSAYLVRPKAHSFLYACAIDWFAHVNLRREVGQLCGYISAVVYLGAYIPQLVKNYRTKSTEGLSMLTFVLVILGNVTYCLSILTLERPTREYLEKYAAWLLGASSTIWLELGILYQFYIYRRRGAAQER